MRRGLTTRLDAAAGRWVRLGSWAVADQVLFGTSNFALGVLLARWMVPSEFGAFAIAQSAFLLFGICHVALLSEPMLVFATSRYRGEFSRYLGHVVRGHWFITGGAAALFLVAAAACRIAGSRSLAGALLGAAFATPPMLLVWLARRASFACFRPSYAAVAGAGYLLLMVAGIALLFGLRLLSPLYAFVVLGACSLLVGTLLMAVLRRLPGIGKELHARDVAREHWRYGRWALASSAITWVTGNAYLFLLPIYGGLASAAAFRALSNLVLPMFQGITALSTLLLPILARARGTPRFRSVLVVASVGFVGSAGIYWMLVGELCRPVIQLLYNGNYAEYAHLLWLLGLLPVLAGVVAVVSNALRAWERPDLVFWAYTASAFCTLTLGLLAVVRWQITGAVLAQVLATSASAVVMVILFRRIRAASGRAFRRVWEQPPSAAHVALVRGRPA